MQTLEERIERAKKELAGNESLLDMLEAEATLEMFDWGQKLAARIVSETDGMDDALAEEANAPRLKALRQSLRAVGNWATGKYATLEDRIQLKVKLLNHLNLILGSKATLITEPDLDSLLNEVDAPDTTPHALILKFKSLVEKVELS